MHFVLIDRDDEHRVVGVQKLLGELEAALYERERLAVAVRIGVVDVVVVVLPVAGFYAKLGCASRDRPSLGLTVSGSIRTKIAAQPDDALCTNPRLAAVGRTDPARTADTSVWGGSPSELCFAVGQEPGEDRINDVRPADIGAGARGRQGALGGRRGSRPRPP